MAAPALDASEAIRQAEELLGSGLVHEAIASLTETNRSSPNAEIEKRLVEVRHHAYDTLGSRRESPPPPLPTVEPTADLEAHRPEDLDLETLRRGMARNGCVLIRGLLDDPTVARMIAGIDSALDGFDRYETDDPADPGWHTPFRPKAGNYRVGGRRSWVRATGGVWTVDSPHMLFELTELLEATGIVDLVTAYFGERPALSANKCNLRRVPVSAMEGWHQDGAFLGRDIRSLNLWIALTDCGDDAPGLDLVPRRIDHIVESGTPGAIFDWSVARDVVDREAGDVGVLRPRFSAGDALLFDHLLLHSTAVSDEMTRDRYAIETWLFAPTAYPEGQIPLVL